MGRRRRLGSILGVTLCCAAPAACSSTSTNPSSDGGAGGKAGSGGSATGGSAGSGGVVASGGGAGQGGSAGSPSSGGNAGAGAADAGCGNADCAKTATCCLAPFDGNSAAMLALQGSVQGSGAHLPASACKEPCGLFDLTPSVENATACLVCMHDKAVTLTCSGTPPTCTTVKGCMGACAPP